jgi:8-oxo-dGTP diphosphatase
MIGDHRRSALSKVDGAAGTKMFSRVLIVDRQERFLCVRQRGPQHDFWTSPGGKVEPGERPDMAVRREVAEEICVTIGFMHFVIAKSMRATQTRWRGFFYYTTEILGVPRIGEPNKITDLRFLSLEQMRAGSKGVPISAVVADYFLRVAVSKDLICRVCTLTAR